ncbi:MAG: ATP-binding protein [Acidobacteria bacterium]|nr:ATP-binding protein [Acidobacteriota bacterium]
MHARRLTVAAALAALAAAVGLLAVSALRTWRETTPWYGLHLAQDESGVRVVNVAPGGPAAEAGVREGDRLLRLGGRPIETEVAAQAILSGHAPGTQLGLVALREGARLPLRVVPAALVRWRPDRVVGSLVGLVFLAGALAVTLRPRGGAADRLYAAWCLAGGVLIGVSWSPAGTPADWPLFWADRVARLFFPALFVHLVLALEPGFRRLRTLVPVLYSPAVALLFVELQLIGLGKASFAAEPVALIDLLQSRAELFWVAGGLSLGLLLLGAAALRARDAAARAKARWILAGTTVGLLPYLLLSADPQWMTGREPAWSWLALPPLALVPLAFTSAVLEYRLMDLALFGRRLTTAIATLAFTLTLFLGILSLTRWALAPLLQPAGLAPALIAAMITALLAPAIRAGTRDLVSRIYYRRHYSFRRALERVARDLNAEFDLPRLASTLERRVSEALDAGVVRLLIVSPAGRLIDPVTQTTLPDSLPADAARRLDRGEVVSLAMLPAAPECLPSLHNARVQVLVPLMVEERLIAVLAVGPRHTARLLDSDDLDLLRSVAHHAAAAVAGAQHLARLEEQVALVQRLQARSEALIDGSPIGMTVIDGEGLIRHFNPALEQMSGRARLAVLGQPYVEVLDPTMVALVSEMSRRVELHGQARAYRVKLGRGPTARLVNLAACRLAATDGSDSVLLTIDDVTDRVQMEEQLIQQDRLASVGMLAAGVAHEVNTPLTGISSFAQILLEETAGDDPRRPLLEKIVQQADRASGIARGLLRLSRPKAVADLNLGPVDLGELIDETVGLLSHQVRQAAATVLTASERPRIVTLGDRSRLQQVVLNLLLNALDAVRPGGHVRVRIGDGPGERVFFEVEDDGVGIPDSVKARIFDPFFTTKKPGQGTGLGLSISYAIVQEHQGTLLAESEAGRGTVMRVVLPAARAAVVPGARTEERRGSLAG